MRGIITRAMVFVGIPVLVVLIGFGVYQALTVMFPLTVPVGITAQANLPDSTQIPLRNADIVNASAMADAFDNADVAGIVDMAGTDEAVDNAYAAVAADNKEVVTAAVDVSTMEGADTFHTVDSTSNDEAVHTFDATDAISMADTDDVGTTDAVVATDGVYMTYAADDSDRVEVADSVDSRYVNYAVDTAVASDTAAISDAVVTSDTTAISVASHTADASDKADAAADTDTSAAVKYGANFPQIILPLPEQGVQVVAPISEYRDTLNEQVSSSETELLARILYAECRGESRQGQLMVAQCVLDRKADGRWGNNISSVVYAAGQFAKPGKLTDELLGVARAAISGERYNSQYKILFFRRSATTNHWHAPYLGHIGVHAYYGYAVRR